MTDTYGAQVLPITATPGAAVTVATGTADPALTYLLSFFKTVANSRLGTAFADSMAPNRTSAATLPIVSVFDHDPEQFEFNDNALPALFMFRNGDEAGAYADVTRDSRVSTESITVLWVLPSATQDKLALRSRFPTKLFHLLDAIVEARRDPAWIVTGDADANAAAEGSNYNDFVSAYSIRFSRGVRRKPLAIKRAESTPIVGYPAYESLIEIREELTRDPSRYDELGGGNVILRTTDQDYGDDGKTLHDFDLDAP